MHSSIILVVLGMLQCMGVFVSSEQPPSVSYQQPPSCQEEKVMVTTEHAVSRLARGLITVTLTSTSTDTTDCTCTETSLPTSVTSGASSSLSSSWPTPSSTSGTVVGVTTTISVTSEAASSLQTTVSAMPTVITIEKPTTVTHWGVTVVTSFATVTALSVGFSGSGTVLTETIIPSTTENLTTQKSTGVTDTNYDTSSQYTSTVVRLTTITIDEPSTATEWSITAATGISTLTETIWGSPDYPSPVTVTETMMQPATSTTYDASSGILPLPKSSISPSIHDEGFTIETSGVKPEYTTTTLSDWNALTELKIESIISTHTVIVTSPEALGVSAEATTTGLFQRTTLEKSSAQSSTHPTEETQISITATSTEARVTPLDETSTWWDSSEMADTIVVESSPLHSTTTSREPSISICPSRITNPTFTPLSPPPKDYTWGCPPHFICNPSKKTVDGECNFEGGPPADTYYCRPEECIRSPKLGPPQFWGPPIMSERIEKYNTTRGYINLNPIEFGLGYDIFYLDQFAWDRKRDWAVKIPGQCYDECNDAMLEAESSGKTPELCSFDSAFYNLVHACRACVNSAPASRSSTGTIPEFQQFLFYCDEAANPTSVARSLPVTPTSSRSYVLTALNNAYANTKVAPTTPNGLTATVQRDVQHTPSVSVARTKSTSAKLPLPTAIGPIYTGAASLLCPPLSLWVAAISNVFCIWNYLRCWR